MQWFSFHIHGHVRNKAEDSAQKSMQAPNGAAKEGKKPASRNLFDRILKLHNTLYSTFPMPGGCGVWYNG